MKRWNSEDIKKELKMSKRQNRYERMIQIIIIDKEKNTVVIDLLKDEYNQLFKGKIDFKKVKRHKTVKELDNEVHEYLKMMKESEQ